MKKALIVNFCLILSSIVYAQSENQTPQNTPGEITHPISKDKIDNQSFKTPIEKLNFEISKKEEKVQSLYFYEEVVEKDYGAYASGGSSKVTKQVKRKIYKAGQTLKDHYNQNLAKAKSEEEITQQLNEILKVNDRLIDLGKMENTRAKEKELKKIKDIATLRSVFFAD